MVFHRSLSDSKSPQVSSTLLSIQADLNNAVVWRVSPRPIISKPSSLCTNPLVSVPRAQITIVIIITFMFRIFFQFPSKVQVHIPLFIFFQFYTMVCRDGKVHNPTNSLFFIDYNKVWSSCLNLVIRLYVKIPEEFVRVILQDRFWVVHILYVRTVKLQFLAQLLLLLLLIRAFHTSISWWSFTGDWVTESFHKSPGLFSVFWPSSIMRLFGWSPLGRQFPNHPGLSIILRLPCQKHHSQLVQS